MTARFTSESSSDTQHRVCYFGWLKGPDSSLKGDVDIDVDVEVNVDIDCYFGCLKGDSKSVQILSHGIEAILVLTLIILKQRAVSTRLQVWSINRFSLFLQVVGPSCWCPC